jgi:hypothetical protein
MRLSLFFVLSVLVASTANAQDCNHTPTVLRCVKFIKNYDGDTITFNIPNVHPLLGEKITVRVSGVDTPEIKTKNDCELESGKRLIERISKDYKNLKPIFIADSLFSNTPFISLLEDKKYKFIIGVKPGNHSYLFGSIETYKSEDKISEYVFTENEEKYNIQFINSVYLNSKEENIVNYIQMEVKDKKGVKKLFSWVSKVFSELFESGVVLYFIKFNGIIVEELRNLM